jgi:membrane protein
MADLRAWAQRQVDRARATLPGRLLQRYLDGNLTAWAAAVAYFAILSLFPLLLSLLTIVGLVLRDPARLAAVASGLVQLFPSEASEPLLAALEGTRENVGLLGLVSLAGLIYGGAGLFGSLETVFDSIYRVPDRDFLAQKLMSTAMLLLFALFLLLFVATASAATALGTISAQALAAIWPGAEQMLAAAPLASGLGWLVSLGWGFLLFLLVYWVVPNRSFGFAQIWPGAFAAALLFLAITQLFPLYLTYLGHINRYGAAFALTFLLLAWFYFLAHILIFGAALNATIEAAQARAALDAGQQTATETP